MAVSLKVVLVLRTLRAFFLSLLLLRLGTLPEAIARLGHVKSSSARPIAPRNLGAIVFRVLHLGPFRPRCLVLSMVHYRLLREQGTGAEMVIGLPRDPVSKDAHAWIEIDGIDVGPPPGKGRNLALARYS